MHFTLLLTFFTALAFVLAHGQSSGCGGGSSGATGFARAGALGDDACLIQTEPATELRRKSEREKQLQPELWRSRNQSRNVVLLFDGTWLQYNGSIFKLTESLVDDHNTQAVWYSIGIRSSLGTGQRMYALFGYSYLTNMYQPGDKIFIFGASRGCAEARYLQSLIFHEGIMKTPLEFDSFDGSEVELIENTIAHSETWKDVEIQVLGCVEGVMRTVFDTDGDTMEPRSSRHLRMMLTPGVRNLLHALALDETQDWYDTAELLPHASTHHEQVWFHGDHEEFCTTHDVMVGWMAERAEKFGLLLKEGFVDSLNYDVSQLLGRTERYNVTARLPDKCRQEVYGGRPVLVHRSVKDMGRAVRGLTSYASCCSNFLKDTANIQWVSTPGYDRNAVEPTKRPMWIKLTFTFTNVTEEVRQKPFFFIAATRNVAVSAEGPVDFEEFVPAAVHVSIDREREKEDLTGKLRTSSELIVLAPRRSDGRYKVMMVEGPACPDIVSCGWRTFYFQNRLYRTTASWFVPRAGDFKDRSLGPTVSVSSESLFDDEAAARNMRVEQPRCAWLRHQDRTDDDDDICSNRGSFWPDTCSKLREQVLAGRVDFGEQGNRDMESLPFGASHGLQPPGLLLLLPSLPALSLVLRPEVQRR